MIAHERTLTAQFTAELLGGHAHHVCYIALSHCAILTVIASKQHRTNTMQPAVLMLAVCPFDSYDSGKSKCQHQERVYRCD